MTKTTNIPQGDALSLPKGYKNSPLGIIPEDWEVKSFRKLFSFKNGINSGKENYGKGVKFVNTLDVLSNNYMTSDTLRGSVAVSDSQKKEFAVVNGDVMFNRTSETPEDIGHASVYIDTQNAVFGGFIIRAHSLDNSFDLDFKKYCFATPCIRKQIIAFGNGAIRYNIGQEDIAKTLIALPPLPEQQKIAEILSTLDAAIETQNQLIQQLELRKRGLMQQLLTGKLRLRSASGERFEGDNLHKKLKPFLTELSVRNNKNQVLNVLSVTNSYGFISQKEQFERVVASADLSNYKIVRKGQFAFNPSRVNVGSLDLLRKNDKGILSPMYIVFETDKKQLNEVFLYYHLKSDNFIRRIPMYVQGSVRDSLSFDGLCSMKFFIPSLPEQTAIAEVLSSTDNQIELEKQKLDALRNQKKGLMQVLLSGKVRVA